MDAQNQIKTRSGKAARCKRNKKIAEKIGQNLKSVRGRLGLSQRDVAIILNISHQQVQKYEAGKNHISASDIAFLCDRWNVSCVDFLKF